jgi:hypothetical protein
MVDNRSKAQLPWLAAGLSGRGSGGSNPLSASAGFDSLRIVGRPRRFCCVSVVVGPGRDAVAGGQGVRVVGTEDPCQVGQQILGQAQRLCRISAPAGQYAMLLRMVRVSGWSSPMTRTRSGSNSLNKRSAWAVLPHWPVQYAILLRLVRVSGWSSPMTRSWSAVAP